MDAGVEVHQSVDILKTIQVSDLHNSDCVCKFVVLCLIGLCSLSTVTEIIVGVNIVTFIIGVTLGVLLTFLILCTYIRRHHHQPSLHPVHVPKQLHPVHQSSEYQDVHLNPASTIPVTRNTAYGCGMQKGFRHGKTTQKD